MKSQILIASLLVLGLALPSSAFAEVANRVQNQNEVQTQNQGETPKVQVQTQEQERLRASESGVQQSAGPGAQLQIGQVNASFNGLLQHFSANRTEVGQQVRSMAQEQLTWQEQIQTQINKLEAKKGLSKTLFGPDYLAIKTLRRQIEQNRVRVREMNQIKNLIKNQADQSALATATQTLEAQNTALENQVQAEESTKSLFGWFFRLFAN